MLITKTLKLVILCAEFEIIILTPGSILYLPNTLCNMYQMYHVPEGTPLLELWGQDNFLCVY